MMGEARLARQPVKRSHGLAVRAFGGLMQRPVFLPFPAIAAPCCNVAVQTYVAHWHSSKGSTDGARLSPQ